MDSVSAVVNSIEIIMDRDTNYYRKLEKIINNKLLPKQMSRPLRLIGPESAVPLVRNECHKYSRLDRCLLKFV